MISMHCMMLQKTYDGFSVVVYCGETATVQDQNTLQIMTTNSSPGETTHESAPVDDTADRKD